MTPKVLIGFIVAAGIVLGIAPAWTTAQVCAADRPPNILVIWGDDNGQSNISRCSVFG